MFSLLYLSNSLWKFPITDRAWSIILRWISKFYMIDSNLSLVFFIEMNSKCWCRVRIHRQRDWGITGHGVTDQWFMIECICPMSISQWHFLFQLHVLWMCYDNIMILSQHILSTCDYTENSNYHIMFRMSSFLWVPISGKHYFLKVAEFECPIGAPPRLGPSCCWPHRWSYYCFGTYLMA